jgi:hypothetical protein
MSLSYNYYNNKTIPISMSNVGTIVTTRFNHDTWRENQENRIKRKLVCFYASPSEMSHKILYNSIVFVVEMNNSINKIEGIGLIRNKPSDKYYHMYSEENYNRYLYLGKYYVSRQQIVEYNPQIVEIFDTILFKGKTHLKRGSGFTRISDKLLRFTEMCVIQEIKNVFLYYHNKI